MRFKDSQNRNLITSRKAEKLKVTHYRNGNPMPKVTNNTAWFNQGNFKIGAYCDYVNTPGNSTTYGKFWSWYAVHDSLNIASTSLHVPKDTEWRTPFKAERATVAMMIEM